METHYEIVRRWVKGLGSQNLRYVLFGFCFDSLVGWLSILKTVCVLNILTVNLLDSRSVMGDLGWVAYPKNGVSMTIAKMFHLLIKITFYGFCGDIGCLFGGTWFLLLSRGI